MNLRVVATDALDRIAASTPSAVYALRRGVVMGLWQKGRKNVLFRRMPTGRIQMELWPRDCHGITEHDLPEDLEQRAAALLDSL